MRDIEKLASAIVRDHSPERVILFGSHAYGTPRADSDVDLLVVVPDGGNPVGKAAEIRSRLSADFPVDVIVRDPAVLRWRIDQHDWFLIEITQRGRVLYDAAHG